MLCPRLISLALATLTFLQRGILVGQERPAMQPGGCSEPRFALMEGFVSEDLRGSLAMQSERSGESLRTSQRQEARAHGIMITMHGGTTLEDLVELARLIDFQIQVPSDVDLSWPIDDLAGTKITLYHLLIEVCREHNLTINYTRSGLELTRTTLSIERNCQRHTTLPIRCKARQYRRLRIWFRVRLVRKRPICESTRPASAEASGSRSGAATADRLKSGRGKRPTK